MALRGSADVASLLVDGYNILGTVTQLTDKQMALTEETHALGDAYVENSYVGVRRAELTQEGFYDDAAASVNAALSTGPGNSSRVLTYQDCGTATGAPFKGLTAVQVDWEVQAARAALTKAKASYLSNGRWDNGQVLYTHKASAGTSAETGGGVQRRDSAGALSTVSSTGGGAGYLQVTAFTSGAGATGALVRIQDSSDNITFADLIAFTIATAAPFAQRIETLATGVEAYVRANTSFQGGASASLTAFVGFARY